MTHVEIYIYYRPKRSFGQGNVFTPVCDSVNRGGGVPDQTPPLRTRQVPPGPGRYPPRAGRTPPGPGRYPPGPGRYPPRPGRYPPRTRQEPLPLPPAPSPRDQIPPPGTADSGIRSTFGRYASYWNAFLLIHFIGHVACNSYIRYLEKIIFHFLTSISGEDMFCMIHYP